MAGIILEAGSGKEEWDAFVMKAPDGGLLQSWQWGEVLKSEGHQIWRLAAKGQDMVGACLVVRYELPGGFSYLVSPRGPIIVADHQEVFQLFLDQIQPLAQSEQAISWKFEPFQWELDWGSALKIRSSSSYSPAETLILDLRKTEAELLAKMHSKTRYNINLAARKRVAIRQGSKADLPDFYKLLKETGQRDRIGIFPLNHYQMIFEKFSENNAVKLYLAEVALTGGQAIMLAGMIVCYFGTFAVYLHGASGNSYRNLMAPSLLQWTAILEAKQKGFLYYDFYGVSSNNRKWQGITRFKCGFAPETTFTSFPGTYEKVFNQTLYLLIKSLKSFRAYFSAIRGFRLKRKLTRVKVQD